MVQIRSYPRNYNSTLSLVSSQSHARYSVKNGRIQFEYDFGAFGLNNNFVGLAGNNSDKKYIVKYIAMSEIEDKDELLLKDHNFNRCKKGTPVEYLSLSNMHMAEQARKRSILPDKEGLNDPASE